MIPAGILAAIAAIGTTITAALVGLGVIRILPAQHVAGILNHRILKTAAGAEKRELLFSRPANGFKHRLIVFIGAARHDPDGVALFHGAQIAELVSREPAKADGGTQMRGGAIDSQRNSLMRNGAGAVIAHQCQVY